MHALGRSPLLPILLAGLLFATSGCMSCRPPLSPPSSSCQSCSDGVEEDWFWRTVPGSCKRRVYVFIVQGCDLFDCSNVSGLRDYINTLGFTKTYHGQIFHGGKFAKEMARIRQEDCEARFVVIGSGSGSKAAYGLAQDAERAGIPVDLLVYLDPTGMPRNACGSETAGRVVRISGGSWASNPDPVDGAYNVVYPDAGYFDVPSHEFTLELLSRELGSVAATVPYMVMDQPMLIEGEPTPIPVSPNQAKPGSEWDFLVPQPLLVPPSTMRSSIPLGVNAPIEN